MAFISITLKDYLQLHLSQNPSENGKEYKQKLRKALHDFKMGKKCTCGRDIWVVGAATVGNYCFECATGEEIPEDDYELDEAIEKEDYVEDVRPLDDKSMTKLQGLFDQLSKGES